MTERKKAKRKGKERRGEKRRGEERKGKKSANHATELDQFVNKHFCSPLYLLVNSASKESGTSQTHKEMCFPLAGC